MAVYHVWINLHLSKKSLEFSCSYSDLGKSHAMFVLWTVSHKLYNRWRHIIINILWQTCHGIVFSCPLTGERWILRRIDPGDSSQGFVVSVWYLGENTVSRHCQSDQEDTETCKLHKLQVYVPSLETLHGQVKWGVLVNTELSRTLN